MKERKEGERKREERRKKLHLDILYSKFRKQKTKHLKESGEFGGLRNNSQKNKDKNYITLLVKNYASKNRMK